MTGSLNPQVPPCRRGASHPYRYTASKFGIVAVQMPSHAGKTQNGI
jgi:hypothetical protein